MIGASIENPIRRITGDEVIDLEQMLLEHKRERIIVAGYVQRGEYYAGYRDRIRTWLRISEYEARPQSNDVVVHVRLGDFIADGKVLDFNYYRKILEGRKFSNVWLTSDDYEHRFIRNFDSFNIRPFKGNAIDTFRFIMSANNIVLSCSTFAWWAAFLSKARQIYLPILKEKRHFWSHHGASEIDLRVPFAEYVFVPDVELANCL